MSDIPDTPGIISWDSDSYSSWPCSDTRSNVLKGDKLLSEVSSAGAWFGMPGSLLQPSRKEKERTSRTFHCQLSFRAPRQSANASCSLHGHLAFLEIPIRQGQIVWKLKTFFFFSPSNTRLRELCPDYREDFISSHFVEDVERPKSYTSQKEGEWFSLSLGDSAVPGCLIWFAQIKNSLPSVPNVGEPPHPTHSG